MPESPSTSTSQEAESNTANLQEASLVISESVDDQVQGQPEHRSYAARSNNPASYRAIYNVGQGVYEKGARRLNGPYWVKGINTDGTYLLRDESGRAVKDRVHERDLQPF